MGKEEHKKAIQKAKERRERRSFDLDTKEAIRNVNRVEFIGVFLAILLVIILLSIAAYNLTQYLYS